MPRVFAPLRRLWLKFGHLLGLIVSPVALGLIYVTTIFPVGLLTRAFGKDLLSLKLQPSASTYWVKPEAGTPPAIAEGSVLIRDRQMRPGDKERL